MPDGKEDPDLDVAQGERLAGDPEAALEHDIRRERHPRLQRHLGAVGADALAIQRHGDAIDGLGRTQRSGHLVGRKDGRRDRLDDPALHAETAIVEGVIGEPHLPLRGGTKARRLEPYRGGTHRADEGLALSEAGSAGLAALAAKVA